MSPDRLAEKTVRIILKKRPRNVYSVNRNPGLLLLDILPESLRLAVIKLLLNKKTKKDSKKENTNA